VLTRRVLRKQRCVYVHACVCGRERRGEKVEKVEKEREENDVQKRDVHAPKETLHRAYGVGTSRRELPAHINT
jgi:hypothetical protein